MRKLVKKNVTKPNAKQERKDFVGLAGPVRNKANVVQFSCVADSRRQHFVMSCRPSYQSERSQGGSNGGFNGGSVLSVDKGCHLAAMSCPRL